jgi:hypothetical protein
MPSIRIKGTPYSSLRDHPTTNEPRSLAEIFPTHGPTLPSTNPVPPRMQRSMPTMREQSEPLSSTIPNTSQSPPRRPRAGTVSSRIHNHCMQSSLRFPRADSIDHDSQPSTSRTASPLLVTHDGMVTMEGSQADIRMRSSGERGRIDSAMNLPTSHIDAAHMRVVDSSGTHHDDIVEHLDVIGRCCILPGPIYSYHFSLVLRPPSCHPLEFNKRGKHNPNVSSGIV